MKTKRMKIATFAFAGAFALIGIALMLTGLFYEEKYQADPNNDALFMNMLLTIPGILFLLDSGFFFLYSRFKRFRTFLLQNVLYFLLLGFLAECVYFQLIYFGVQEPQYKMVIPAFFIMLVYSVLVLLLTLPFRFAAEPAMLKQTH